MKGRRPAPQPEKCTQYTNIGSNLKTHIKTISISGINLQSSAVPYLPSPLGPYTYTYSLLYRTAYTWPLAGSGQTRRVTRPIVQAQQVP